MRMHVLIKNCSIIAGCFMASFSLWGNNSTPSNINPYGSLVILENLPGGETVDTFSANDADPGTTLAFSLLDGNTTFSIDSSGILKTKGSLDYEKAQEHTIRVKVRDEQNASTEKVFTVTVLDMDEGQAPSSGNGSTQDPFKIENLAHLKWLSYTPSVFNKHFILANDINASQTSTWANGYGFKPIGGSPQFRGSFDGKGYSISGLTVNRPSISSIGFFARLQKARISNLHLTDANVTGHTSVGLLVGNQANSTIENCSAIGSVSGIKTVGGLVGFSAVRSKIINSKSAGSVRGTKDRIGGLVGHNYTSSQITDCYSSAAVHGQHKWSGGFVGINTAKGSISRCYSIGSSNHKGFVGSSHNGGVISDSFWDLESSNQPAGVGPGRTGKTTYQMKSHSTFTVAGWNINASGGSWKILQGITYPLLSWEPLPIFLPSEVFFHPGIIIENQPAGAFAGKVHALVNSYQYTPGYGNGEKVVIVKDANHMGVSFIRGEELTVTGIGNGGTVNGRIIYRPRVDKGGLWLHGLGKGSWWEAADRQVSYSLVTGTGSAHNGLFSIDVDGNIRTLVPLDYESTPSLQLRVRISKGNLAWIEKALTIPLWDDPNENLPVVVESESKSSDSQSSSPDDNQTASSNGNEQKQSQNSDSDPTEQNNKTVSSPSIAPQPVVRRTPVYQVPIVRTQEARESIAGQWNFSGKITTNGNFPIFDRGFQISPSIGFETFLQLPVPLDFDKTDFNATYRASEFSPDRIYYYRSYARNAVGASFGSVRKFVPYSNSPKAWWEKTAEDQGGWRSSPWFGTFRRQTDTDWIYHAQLGWAYAHPDGSGGLWLWFRDHHWTWTQSEAYPYLWNHDLGGWLYLMGTRNGKPVFYHYESGSIR